MNTETQLATQEPSVAIMLSGFIEKGITAENVAAFAQLVALKERMDDRSSERAFAEALTALQGETIRVKATKAVDQKADGTCRYRFAPYEEIMAAVQPMLTRHGFSVTFDTEITPDGMRLTSLCTLTHSSGHSRTNKFAVRFGKPPGSSDAQGDMSTKSYAKRGALCDALNISIDHDDDAAAEGDNISMNDAYELRDWVQAIGADQEQFLKFAGAETFQTISQSRLTSLRSALKEKEAKMKAK
jgi:hypothetical protein